MDAYESNGGGLVSVLWETGLGSCLIIVIGCAAAFRGITAKEKPAVAAAGQNI